MCCVRRDYRGCQPAARLRWCPDNNRQLFLEDTFPTYHPVAPTKKGQAATDAKARAGSTKRLNVANTLAKTALDQTAGAFANTMLFSLCMNAAQMATKARAAGESSSSLAFLLAGGAADFSAVDWAAVLARSRAEFWTLVRAGWCFWPFVSLVNFSLVPTVEARNLVGSLAGVVWGVYMSLFAAGR